jgi:DNA-binding transcriptional LysR family regulator
MKEPIDSRQLRAFVTLARTGSFTMTAKELFLSQSAVSHSMKALETDVGCRLFDRVGKKVLLTQAGETLLQHAVKILSEMAAARLELEQLGKWGMGRLRVAAGSAISQYLLPAVLKQFKEKFPKCLVMVEQTEPARAVELIRANVVDMAFTLQPREEDQIQFEPLFIDELMFAVHPEHTWARAGQVVRAEIPRQGYALQRKNTPTFRAIEEYFREDEVVLNTVIEAGSIEAIKELVKFGLGVGILSPWTARREAQEGTLVLLPLGRRKLRRTWGLVHWRGRRLSLAEETFLSLCKVHATDLSQELRTDRVSQNAR